MTTFAQPRARGVAVLLAALALASAATSASAAVALPQLHIDTGQITVSGLSSGGFMANQLGYAE